MQTKSATESRVRPLYKRFLAFSRGPGGFRELREAGRIHFHLSWYLSDDVVTSYDQKLWGGILGGVRDYLGEVFSGKMKGTKKDKSGKIWGKIRKVKKSY